MKERLQKGFHVLANDLIEKWSTQIHCLWNKKMIVITMTQRKVPETQGVVYKVNCLECSSIYSDEIGRKLEWK